MEIQEFIAEQGLTMAAEISRNGNPNMTDMPKGSMHFSCTISKGEKGANYQSLETAYSVGPGIVDSWIREHGPTVFGGALASITGEHGGKYYSRNLSSPSMTRKHYLVDTDTMDAHAYRVAAGYAYRPELVDVLDCLASDAGGYENARGFEDWASEYGYDTDSRKAYATFETVEEQAKELHRLLGTGAFNQLLWEVERQ